jgi:hypothetical protein
MANEHLYDPLKAAIKRLTKSVTAARKRIEEETGEKFVQPDDDPVSSGPHWTYGILRRREQDEPFGYCYEMPDGDLVYSPRPCHKNKAIFLCLRDAETGERYLTLHP